MTAFLALPYADRIELLADGATCLPNGMLIAATDKIVASEHVPLAMVGRGNHGDLRTMTDAILKLATCGSVDATLEQLVGALEDVRSEPGDLPDQHFEIIIAAFSETRGPCQFVLNSFEREGRPSWTLIDRSGEMIGGGNLPEQSDIAAAGLDAETFVDGAAVGGLALMEMMRRIPGSDFTRHGATHGYWIGCHVDHAVVSADGVTVTRIQTWPDELFKLIDPEPKPPIDVIAAQVQRL